MIVLACATKQECLSALTALQHHPQTWPALIKIGRGEVLVSIVGIGPIAAALSIGQLLQSYSQIKGLINLGICGVYDFDAPVEPQPYVADVEIFPEYGLRLTHAETEQEFRHQMLENYPLSPVNYLDLKPQQAAQNMNLFLPPAWAMGPSLTVSGVSGDLQRARVLKQKYQASTENMEGFALALAAHLYGLPFLEIRTVSNMAGIQDKRQWKIAQAFKALGEILPILTRPWS